MGKYKPLDKRFPIPGKTSIISREECEQMAKEQGERMKDYFKKSEAWHYQMKKKMMTDPFIFDTYSWVA